MTTLLIILIATVYFAGGSVFALAYIKGYPFDEDPNIGLMVLFWVFIAIGQVLYHLFKSIGDISVGMADRITASRYEKKVGAGKQQKRNP